ncbi:hypothetical protein [Halobiforma nitratireducens]|uniref:hypothetical protein n=1 Tax=Halobiforma nitratireducens TaxID=130048 RepID=UPI001268CB0E|nr:hypothetical protein [Halobiforma nitratireducens]
MSTDTETTVAGTRSRFTPVLDVDTGAGSGDPTTADAASVERDGLGEATGRTRSSSAAGQPSESGLQGTDVASRIQSPSLSAPTTRHGPDDDAATSDVSMAVADSTEREADDSKRGRSTSRRPPRSGNETESSTTVGEPSLARTVDDSPSLTAPVRIRSSDTVGAVEPARSHDDDEINKFKKHQLESTTDESMETASSSSERPSLVYRGSQPLGVTDGESQSHDDGTQAPETRINGGQTDDTGRASVLSSRADDRVVDDPPATRGDRRATTDRTAATQGRGTPDRHEGGRRRENVTNREAMGSDRRPDSGRSPAHRGGRGDGFDRGPSSGPRPGPAAGPGHQSGPSPTDGRGGSPRDQDQYHGFTDRTPRTSSQHSHGTNRSRDRRTDTDVPIPDESLRYEADVDRVVERLYRKLERRKRIERERRGNR